MPGEKAFTQVVAGDRHTCALDAEAKAWCWGGGDQAQRGDGRLTDQVTPVAVSGGRGYQTLVAGGAHTCGLSFGTVYCWGRGAEGQLGSGATSLQGNPAPVPGTFGGVTAGFAHTCALEASGTIRCWGDGNKGQLGTGIFAGSTTPVAVKSSVPFHRLAR